MPLGGDRSDKSGGPGTNRWIKEQGKYRYLVFRPLCAFGGKVSVHRLIPGRHSGFGVSISIKELKGRFAQWYNHRQRNTNFLPEIENTACGTFSHSDRSSY
jgi:hypothetical protein